MVYITGYGVISSIGNNVEQTLASLVAQKTGIQQGKQEHTKLFNVGEINYSNDELSDFFQLSIKEKLLSPLLSLCCVINLGIFYLSIHFERFKIAKGIILATFLYGFAIVLLKFFL